VFFLVSLFNLSSSILCSFFWTMTLTNLTIIPGSLLMMFFANDASNGMSLALRQLNTIVKFFKVSALSALSLNSSKFDNRPALYNARPNLYPFENAFSKLSSSFKFIFPFEVSQFQATLRYTATKRNLQKTDGIVTLSDTLFQRTYSWYCTRARMPQHPCGFGTHWSLR